ncbi:MAG: type VI secretion system baseplate subunit TssE [Rhodobacterales bacterium]|nr:type VI secretion system baseplate subunit TssE [Rhodobacterales bacterium]
MADRNIIERLQPSLLDRLTDREPEKRSESRDTRVIDINRLRDIIRRDLVWLLNANNLDTELDAARFPQIRNSVLNFGVREVAGTFGGRDRAAEIRKSMQTAIRRFEPRINEGTLDVIMREAEQGRQSVIVFDIVADMWAEPLPLQLYLKSEVDITTGEVTLDEAR